MKGVYLKCLHQHSATSLLWEIITLFSHYHISAESFKFSNLLSYHSITHELQSAYEMQLLLLLLHQTYYLSQHIFMIHRTFTCFSCVKYVKSSVTNTNTSAILSVDTDSAQVDQTTTTVPHWSYLKLSS